MNWKEYPKEKPPEWTYVLCRKRYWNAEYFYQMDMFVPDNRNRWQNGGDVSHWCVIVPPEIKEKKTTRRKRNGNGFGHKISPAKTG